MEERFNEGFFVPVWGGGLYLEGLIHEGVYFRNFTVLDREVEKNYKMFANPVFITPGSNVYLSL